jgi:hypothetical protein
MSNDLVEVVYVSAAVRPFSADELRELLRVARTNNGRVGVTGMLVYAQCSFLQVLEGRPDDVMRVFERIQHDRRHYRVLRMFSTPKPERHFGDWTMGFADASPETVATPGFNDFFRVGFSKALYDAEEADKVRSLAHQFRLGRWRQCVSAD